MSGWSVVPLLEVCRAYQPQTIGRKDMDNDGPFPVYGANGVIGRYHSFNHEESEVLLGCRGSCGSVNVSEPKSWVTGNAMVIKPRDHRLSKEFLRYVLDGSEEIAKTITGVAQPQITQKSLAPVSIPLPPLEEQRRIVAVLDEAFAAIATATANAEKNLANARELFELTLEEAFSEDGSGWHQCALSKLIDISHGFAFKGPDFENAGDETKPIVLTPGNYTEDAELAFTPRNTKRLVKGIPPQGFEFEVGDLTVVMTDLSSKMKILGRPAFVNAPNVLHNQRIGRVLFSSAAIEPRLVYYAMQRPSALKHVRDTATGTMVRHTAPKRILANSVSFPIHRTDQRALVARLDSIRFETMALRTIQSERLEALSKLREALLQRAFSGELTEREPLAA